MTLAGSVRQYLLIIYVRDKKRPMGSCHLGVFCVASFNKPPAMQGKRSITECL